MPEGYAIDAYYLENNYFARKYLAGLTGEDVRGYAARLFPFYADTIEYPFKNLAIVEIPASFALFHRHDENRDDCIQPGLVLWLEEGINSFQGHFTNPPGKEDMFYTKLLPWTWVRLSLGSVDPEPYELQALFAGHGYTIRSDEFPALDRAWRTIMFQLRTFPSIETPVDDSVFRLLCTRSLGEVFRDRSLSPAARQAVVRVRGEMLFRHLLLDVTRADLYRLHRQLERRFPARPVELDAFLEALREVTGEDQRPFIKEWHDGVGGLPEFVIRDPRVETFLVDEKRWQRVRFKIHNRGKTGGIVSLAFNFADNDDESFPVAPGEYTEVVASRPGRISEVEMRFGFSMNVPSRAHFSFPGKGAPLADNFMQGARETDPAAFALPPGTIIVDNRDEGFRVIETVPWIERFLPPRANAMPRNLHRPTLPPRHRWTEWGDINAHGDGVRSYHRRQAGTGKSRVEWTATIEEGGVYDLHVFASHRLPAMLFQQRKATFYYSVSTPGEETVEIPLALYEPLEYWVHLGRFRVTPGDCTVSLDDRATLPDHPAFALAPPGSMPVFVHADAIRWTRVGAP
jgi:hypothetical protein